MISVKYILTKYAAMLVPVIQMIVTAYSAFKPITGINVGDTIGYSMFTNLVYFIFYRYYYKGDKKYIPLICTIGLFVMNFVSWSKHKFEYDFFEAIYDYSTLVICTGCSFLILQHWYKERKEYVKIK